MSHSTIVRFRVRRKTIRPAGQTGNICPDFDRTNNRLFGRRTVCPPLTMTVGYLTMKLSILVNFFKTSRRLYLSFLNLFRSYCGLAVTEMICIYRARDQIKIAYWLFTKVLFNSDKWLNINNSNRVKLKKAFLNQN